jgi:hypothetical protein
MLAIRDEPDDVIWVEPVVGRPPRDGRRHVIVPDKAWLPLGEEAAQGDTAGRLRARIALNGVAMELELLSTELSDYDVRDWGARYPAREYPELRVRGRSYYLVGIYAV